MYGKALISQIEESGKMRLFQGVMTDYERKVNGADIVAYTNSPGCPANDGPRKKNAESGANIISGTDSETLLARRINPRLPFHGLAQRESAASDTIESRPADSPERLVRLAEQNMRDPGVAVMRRDTHNRAYGCYRHERAAAGPLSNSVNYSAAPTLQQEVREGRLAAAGKELVRNSSELVRAAGGSMEPGSRNCADNAASEGRREPWLKPVGSMRGRIAAYNIITGKEVGTGDATAKKPIFGPRNANPFAAMHYC